MGKLVIASLEGNEVKIIHSSTKFDIIHEKWKIIHFEKWDIHHVEKKEVIAEKEFNAYLDKEDTEEYVVVCDFDESFHDILLIPALKQKFIKKVIGSEIRKATQKTDFTFVYSILGDKVINNKKMIEVFYYMVTNELIHNVIKRFYDHGKIVKALYPAVFAAAAFIDRKASNEIKMGVIVAGYKRIVFTTENGIVNFVRDYDSLEDGISDFDIQNINMTLSYCSKNLHIEPSSITFLGNPRGLSALKIKPAIPLAQPDMLENTQCDGKVTSDYFIPCSATNVLRTVNMLSENFKNIYLMRRLLALASLTFVMLSVIYSGLIFYIAKDVFQIRQEIQSVVLELSGVEKYYEEYLDRQETMKDIIPFVDFLNRPAIDIETFLIEMSGIELQDLRFDEINAEAEGDASFLISIKGRGLFDAHAAFHNSFDKLIDRLEKMNNVELKNKVVNHMDKTFLVELRYGK